MDQSELEHLRNQIEALQKERRELELQVAKSGIWVPPAIKIRLDEVKEKIEALRQEIEQAERNQPGERHARPADATTNMEQPGLSELENDIGELEKNMSKGANSVSAKPEPSGGWRDKPVILIAPAGLVLVIILLLSGIVPWPSGGEFFYQVRLKDEDTRAAIAFSEVIIEVDGRQFKANTGTDGLARVKIPSEFEGRPGKIIIRVTGYEDKEQSIDVNDTGTSTTVLLTPVEEEGAEEEAEVMDEAEAP